MSKQYTESFKIKAIEKITEGQPYKKVAKKFRVAEGTLITWVKKRKSLVAAQQRENVAELAKTTAVEKLQAENKHLSEQLFNVRLTEQKLLARLNQATNLLGHLALIADSISIAGTTVNQQRGQNVASQNLEKRIN